MKRTTAIAMYQAVLGIKLNKMSDDMTEAIISNTLALADVNNSFQNAQTTARKLTVETIDKDRLTAYDELTTKMNALEGTKRMAVQAVINDNYKDVQSQLKRLNKAIDAYLDKEAEVELKQIDRKEFCKACRDAEQNLTPATMQVLAPMFNGYVEPKNEVDEAEIKALLDE